MSGKENSPPTKGTQRPQQAVTGLVPPQIGEALIRETWPSVINASVPGAAALARLAQLLSDTIILRPLAWMLLLPLFVARMTPFFAKRYRLTNQRLMMIRFGRRKPYREIPLADIEDVRIEPDSINSYFRCGTLDVISQGQTALRLQGVKEPESFRFAILNACSAWAPRRPKDVLRPEKEAPTLASR